MRSVVWLLREDKSASPKYLSFSERLLNEGLRSHWLNLAGINEQTTQWLIENLPTDTSYVFVYEQDSKWLKEVASLLHSLPIPNKSALPVYLIYDHLDAATLTGLSMTGVDDLVALSENPRDVLPRLKLRECQVLERAAILNQMRDQKTVEAKNETIMKQREEFLSVCAHDLRSPLGLIQSNISLLMTNSKTTMDEFQTELLVRAKRQAGQAITLVNDLLDVMSFEQGLKPQYEMLNLHGFLKEFHADYSQQAAQKGIRVQYDNPIKDWRVLADADRIRQLLQNLFVNAVKFTEKDKKIYINVMPFTGRRKNDPPYPMIIISLKDEGKGIPQKELQKIFDRFTQVKDTGRAEGRGLGLTVAKQISTLHDGNIWVQSVEGEGSTFFVLFPHVISRSLPLQKSTDVKAKKKVVITEANVERREQYFELLGRWGYEPIYAKNGVEAITFAFHYSPELVILQPGLSKLEEAQVSNILKLDTLTASIPILLGLDANPNLTQPQKAFDELAFDGLVKLPFNRESFQIALDRALTKKGKLAKMKKAA